MQEHLQILHELYRTEPYGPWHTRECFPWEYDVKIQECVKLANQQRSESDQSWFLDQAKIFQIRANHLRQERTALASRSPLIKSPPTPQSDLSSVQSITQPSLNSLAKKKRNMRSRNQKKRKAQAQTHVTVQIQEVEHSLGAWNKPDKHVVLQGLKLGAWEYCWHAVVQSDWLTMVAGMIIQYGVNGMRRLGIG